MAEKKSKKKRRPGLWLDELAASVGRFIHVETKEGVLREGKLTGIRYEDLEINGKKRDVLTALELDGDPSDYIDFSVMRRITID